MQELKALDITKGIARYLKSNYPKFKIYEISPEQGLELPCFIIEQGRSYVSRRYASSRVGTLSLDRENFTIRILSNDIRELRDVAFDLKLRFDTFDLEDGPVRLQNKQISYIESNYEMLLTFYIILDTLIPSTSVQKMEVLEVREGINGKTNS